MSKRLHLLGGKGAVCGEKSWQAGQCLVSNSKDSGWESGIIEETCKASQCHVQQESNRCKEGSGKQASPASLVCRSILTKLFNSAVPSSICNAVWQDRGSR